MTFRDFGPVIRVDGGLVARSTRGAIGEQWWSQRFLAVLESFSLGTRLTRGKSYARQGQVLSLAVEPGLVSATVQGSRPKPYEVTVRLPAYGDDVWAVVTGALAAQAIHKARLLNGEMPAELEQVFAAAGSPLFPERFLDLRMNCSCPDSAVPCKHIAATFYLLAERFDDDPFEILLWRGRSREQLLGRLRAARPALLGAAAALAPVDPAPAVAPVTETDGEGDGPASAPADDPVSPPRDDPARSPRDGPARSFWDVPVAPPLPVHPELPPGVLLQQLGTPPAVLGGRALTDALAPMYERFADLG